MRRVHFSQLRLSLALSLVVRHTKGKGSQRSDIEIFVCASKLAKVAASYSTFYWSESVIDQEEKSKEKTRLTSRESARVINVKPYVEYT